MSDMEIGTDGGMLSFRQNSEKFRYEAKCKRLFLITLVTLGLAFPVTVPLIIHYRRKGRRIGVSKRI